MKKRDPNPFADSYTFTRSQLATIRKIYLANRSPYCFTVMVTPSQRRIILRKARLWTGGNVSGFLRFAALAFEPTDFDLL